MLVEGMRALGPWSTGTASAKAELESFHRDMCEELGWLWRKWPAVGRELKKLQGVRKGKSLVRRPKADGLRDWPSEERPASISRGEAAQAGVNLLLSELLRLLGQ